VLEGQHQQAIALRFELVTYGAAVPAIREEVPYQPGAG
jgi:hypothetical protein